MDELTEAELEIFARKEAMRERDRKLVAEGKATWEEINHANTFGATLAGQYTYSTKLGVKK